MAKKSKKHKHKKSSKHNTDKTATLVTDAATTEDVEIETDLVINTNDDIEANDLRLPAGDSTLSGIEIGSKLDISTEKGNLKSSKKAEKTKPSGGGGSSSKKRKTDGNKADDDTDSAEERWLHAIESGKLDEVDDELKRMKNPRLMTARQRALLEKRTDGTLDKRPDGFEDTNVVIPTEPLLALPSGFKEKVITEEMLAKKAIKSRKRREQAQEKREEDKKKTVDRLLKKQDSKSIRPSKTKLHRKDTPLLSLIDGEDGKRILIPHGLPSPFVHKEAKPPPPVVLCGVTGCRQPKKYTCSKSGVPLCSLQCYQKNSAARQLTPAAS